MSQISQGIEGQGVPGDMWPRQKHRTSSTNRAPAIDGRYHVVDGNSFEQAARDQVWQDRLLAERTAAAAAREKNGSKRIVTPHVRTTPPFGPAAGIAAELRRIHPSGLHQLSPALEARCESLGWTLEHLGATIGTIIHGAELKRTQSDEEIETMYAVFLERKVICFRDQPFMF